MKIARTDILARLEQLPDDAGECVRILSPGTAEVDSFSDPAADPHVVRIQPHSDEPTTHLNVHCGCDASGLCRHIVAFYAYAKGFIRKDQGTSERLVTALSGLIEQQRQAAQQLLDLTIRAEYVLSGGKEEDECTSTPSP